MEDRRKSLRLDASLGVTWYKLTETKGQEVVRSDVAKNISSLGLCLIVYEKLEVGEQLSLTIELPDKNPISTTGRVCWVRLFQVPGMDVPENYDIGIEFLDMKKEDRHVLKQYVLFPKGYK